MIMLPITEVKEMTSFITIPYIWSFMLHQSIQSYPSHTVYLMKYAGLFVSCVVFVTVDLRYEFASDNEITLKNMDYPFGT